MTAPDSVDSTVPRWRRLPEERPRQIIDAAFEVFGEFGLEGARLDEIARRAGVSKGTIYLYFNSKEELFRAVVESKVVSVIEAAEADFERDSSAELSAREAFRHLLRAHWDYLRSPTYQTMYRLTHSEMPHFPDLCRFYGTEVVERKLRLTASIIRRGIDRGEFRHVDPMLTARIIGSMFLANAVGFERRHLFQSSTFESADLLRDAQIEFVLQGLARAGHHTPEPPASDV